MPLAIPMVGNPPDAAAAAPGPAQALSDVLKGRSVIPDIFF